jgi:rhomboid protease GluP
LNLSTNPMLFLSPDSQGLLLLGATGTIPIDRLHHWWTLVSASYLHGGILHIVFNMLALRQISPLVIREYGTHRMIVIYTLSGVGGFLASYLAGVGFTIGASAAVCGLIGAALYYGKRRSDNYGRAVYRQVGGWALGIVLFGLLVPGINNWAHGGGMTAGFLMGLLMGYQERKKENMRHRLLGSLCVFGTAAVLFWTVFTGIVYRF